LPVPVPVRSQKPGGPGSCASPTAGASEDTDLGGSVPGAPPGAWARPASPPPRPRPHHWCWCHHPPPTKDTTGPQRHWHWGAPLRPPQPTTADVGGVGPSPSHDGRCAMPTSAGYKHMALGEEQLPVCGPQPARRGGCEQMPRACAYRQQGVGETVFPAVIFSLVRTAKEICPNGVLW
jgi:hypothetical protein